MSCLLVLCSSLLVIAAASDSKLPSSPPPPPPLPVLPIPSSKQLHWQRRERSIFFHFGMNTFTDSETGTGLEDPRLFFPTHLNARQWVSVAKDAGFTLVVLVAKHHDGFCLWPSKYTNHSVASSFWKSGKGDVVRELTDAVAEAGIDLGLYLSPWDRHEPSYGNTLDYNKHYLAQMRELLTNYGNISEVWLDGAKGNISMEYKFDEWFETIHQLQPGALIFSDAGPDTRWVGDEQGRAGATCWSMVRRSSIQIGNSGPILQYLNQGDEHGSDWVPPECDVSIRTGWFWHRSERPKDLWSLLDIYYTSVGRNCVLLLNVPPNSSGLISDEDSKTLRALSTAITTIFSVNLAASPLSVTASSAYSTEHGPHQVLTPDISSFWSPREGEAAGWLMLDLGKPTLFNLVKIQEAIAWGQRVRYHRVDVLSVTRGWTTVAQGTTIGYKRLHRLKLIVKAQLVKLVILDSRAAPPLVASFGLYLDPYPHVGNDTSVIS
ncbi:hypothetical protein SELMODRAFT_448790 [Selaginella moellendorffii]|uniref:alpha-L-fucosidase n=1 Tax=Selaginella moellendorffii TaxID=88036 RepID=D8TA89_SELML|nr:alpha-L-fucosidase 1 [Selaginella moellendorffii]EFJ06423.1 hypothetical protein SELMODRAFT_448790 [Selaginella moellendorffii]|eukprot:XP_002992485.1 alpha-L-fucosidase 1 [Selaginella moellendorffii]